MKPTQQSVYDCLEPLCRQREPEPALHHCAEPREDKTINPAPVFRTIFGSPRPTVGPGSPGNGSDVKNGADFATNQPLRPNLRPIHGQITICPRWASTPGGCRPPGPPFQSGGREPTIITWWGVGGRQPARVYAHVQYRCLRSKRPSKPFDFIGFEAMENYLYDCSLYCYYL